jgi:hypothetical protein
MGMHLFHYTHGGERTISHDVVQDAFVAIARNVGFHVSQEQTHVLLLPAFQFLCR